MAGAVLPDTEDAEEFIEKVDEVTRLIEGLKAGTISPEYIDTKLHQKQEKEQAKLQTVQKRPAARGPSSTSQQGASATDPSPQQDAAADDDEEDEESERRERAMAKVKELMANRDRKLKARARYEEYVRSQDKSQFGTDYTKWDIWCPEDEEDDLINSIGPNTPQFRAMEKDIDERHRQMVERRQLAERCRVAGNEAYKSRQYSEALRCYQQGIESERTNMTLHANAAMAALKMNCYVQAVEHCDKVLSIAEFLHNNRKDPLCVKALQRRAEAFRALQQHHRAVQDLQRALELEPGNAEAAAQLAKARQEDEEARKQRAIAKAVRGSTAAAASSGGGKGGSEAAEGSGEGEGGVGGTVEAAGVVLDLEKLGRLERMAASLAPAAGTPAAAAEAGAAAQTSGDSATGSSGGNGVDGQGQEAAGGRGPTLPPRRQPRQDDGKAAACSGGASVSADPAAGSGAEVPGPSSGGSVAETCGQLRELLRGDDACCVYLRECGGLQHIAARISKYRSGPSASPFGNLAALLLLLNDACMNDGNLKQLPALKVLPAAVAALDGAGEEAAAAAAALLCTAVTQEDVRKEVSKQLGNAEAMGKLIRLLSTGKPTVQGIALALLGNCMVDKPTKAAAGAAWRQDAAAAACFLALLRSPTAVLAEKAAVLLGNMATDTGLRADILGRQAQDGVVRQLVALAGSGLSDGARRQQQPAAAVAAADLDLQRAAAAALFNLTVDPQGQQLVADDAEGLGALYRLVVPAGPGQQQVDRTLAARAAGVCARAARVPAGAATLLKLGAVAGMLGAVSAALDALEVGAGASDSSSAVPGGQGAGAAGKEREASAALLDAAVRTVTVLTSPDDPALPGQVVASGGLPVLLRVVRAGSGGVAAGSAPPAPAAAAASSAATAVGESVLANTALCLAAVARCKEHLAALRALDAVPPLLAVAYQGRGNTASKNAAIALARMAQEPAMLEQLRELHGIEIIYQYVKP